MSFMFFSKQFQTHQVKEAVAVMRESEKDDSSQVLKPLAKGEENVRRGEREREREKQREEERERE